jgi:hypothetical protein
MTRGYRQTFEEMILAVAPVNASALEEKARKAGDLAKAYPQSATLFVAVEDRLLQQLWKVMSRLFRAAVPNATLMPSEPGENPSGALPVFPR